MSDRADCISDILDVESYLVRLTGIHGWMDDGITRRWSPERGHQETQDYVFPLPDGEMMRAMFMVGGTPGQTTSISVLVSRFDAHGEDIGDRDEVRSAETDLVSGEYDGPEIHDLLYDGYAARSALAA